MGTVGRVGEWGGVSVGRTHNKGCVTCRVWTLQDYFLSLSVLKGKNIQNQVRIDLSGREFLLGF
jgi:hypothetical protein